MEPGGSTPTGLWLLESFLNSIDVESQQDDLADCDNFRRWLEEHGRGESASQVSDDDLHLARRLRADLRAILTAHHDPSVTANDHESLNEMLRSLTVRVTFDAAGDATISADGQGVGRFLTEIVIAVVDASADGGWQRMKLCPAVDCAVAYYDTSKNRSKRWCSMRTCGNRSKTRNYYHRSMDANVQKP